MAECKQSQHRRGAAAPAVNNSMQQLLQANERHKHFEDQDHLDMSFGKSCNSQIKLMNITQTNMAQSTQYSLNQSNRQHIKAPKMSSNSVQIPQLNHEQVKTKKTNKSFNISRNDKSMNKSIMKMSSFEKRHSIKESESANSSYSI